MNAGEVMTGVSFEAQDKHCMNRPEGLCIRATAVTTAGWPGEYLRQHSPAGGTSRR